MQENLDLTGLSGDAAFVLGLKYVKGDGVPRDPGRALTLFEHAAATGNDRAQYNLGVMYLNGVGVQKDTAAALGWLRGAAEKGHPQARMALEKLGSSALAAVDAPAESVGPTSTPDRTSTPSAAPDAGVGDSDPVASRGWIARQGKPMQWGIFLVLFALALSLKSVIFSASGNPLIGRWKCVSWDGQHNRYELEFRKNDAKVFQSTMGVVFADETRDVSYEVSDNRVRVQYHFDDGSKGLSDEFEVVTEDKIVMISSAHKLVFRRE